MNDLSLSADGHGDPCERTFPTLQKLFAEFRPRLRMLVELRIDRRIRARIDASDVVQEAFAEAVRRFPVYQQDASMSPYVWLRFLTLQQLLIAHRRHLSVKARSAAIERPFELLRELSVESGSLAEFLVGNESSPSVKVQRNEEIQQLNSAIEQMDALDREILVLRHFERLEYAEIAKILDLTVAAVSSRYRRSLKKLGKVIVGENRDNH